MLVEFFKILICDPMMTSTRFNTNFVSRFIVWNIILSPFIIGTGFGMCGTPDRNPKYPDCVVKWSLNLSFLKHITSRIDEALKSDMAIM